MSDVVSLPPPSEPPPEAPADEIAVGDWYPSIKLSELREAMRIHTVVTDFRLRDAAIGAIATVLQGLESWKAVQVAAGVESLDAVLAPEIDGESVNLHRYRRAIYSFAAADLAETHRNITATAQGVDRAAEDELTADDHRRNAAWALSDIVGRRRTTIELI